MTTLVQCDQCKKTETEGRTLNWWRIEALDQFTYMSADELPPFTFCSWACVGAFAQGRQVKPSSTPSGEFRFTGFKMGEDGRWHP